MFARHSTKSLRGPYGGKAPRLPPFMLVRGPRRTSFEWAGVARQRRPNPALLLRKSSRLHQGYVILGLTKIIEEPQETQP
jgi:hypothetical protein